MVNCPTISVVPKDSASTSYTTTSSTIIPLAMVRIGKFVFGCVDSPLIAVMVTKAITPSQPGVATRLKRSIDPSAPCGQGGPSAIVSEPEQAASGSESTSAAPWPAPITINSTPITGRASNNLYASLMVSPLVLHTTNFYYSRTYPAALVASCDRSILGHPNSLERKISEREN